MVNWTPVPHNLTAGDLPPSLVTKVRRGRAEHVPCRAGGQVARNWVPSSPWLYND